MEANRESVRTFGAGKVKGDMSDYTMYYGRGAGRQPTASTVVGDIGDIARNLAHGETRYVRAVPNYAEGQIKLRAAGDIVSKFYIRFMVTDKPGAFGTIASLLGKHGVSISAASQKAGNVGNEPVPVVVLTHAAKTADVEAALAETYRPFVAPSFVACAPSVGCRLSAVGCRLSPPDSRPVCRLSFVGCRRHRR